MRCPVAGVVALSLTLAVVLLIAPPGRVAAQGATWTPLGLQRANLFALIADPASPGMLYAGGAYREGAPTSTLYSNFFRSSDSGNTWQRAILDQDVGAVLALAVAPPAQPTLLYATGPFGVSVSRDRGTTWLTATELNSGHQMLVDPEVASSLYLAAPDAVYMSPDAATTWRRLTVAPKPCDFRTLAFASATPRALYAGGGCGVFESQDRGTTWQQLAAAPTNVVTLTADPADPMRIYAGSVDPPPIGGLWQSGDGGRSWERLEAGKRVDVVLIDPRDPRTIFVAGSGPTDVLWSRDRGATWSPLGDRAPSHGIVALVVMGDRLVAAGYGGVWQMAIPAAAGSMPMLPGTGAGGCHDLQCPGFPAQRAGGEGDCSGRYDR